jgi:hypothetical protein
MPTDSGGDFWLKYLQTPFLLATVAVCFVVKVVETNRQERHLE